MDEKTKRLIQIFRDAKFEFSEEHLVLIVPQFISKSFTSYCSMSEDLKLIL